MLRIYFVGNKDCAHCKYLTKRIAQYYTTIANQQTVLTVNHFLAENVPHRIIYNIMRKYTASGIIGDKL